MWKAINCLIFIVFIWAFTDTATARETTDRPPQAITTIAAGAPFTRIISLYGAHTENLFALGLDDEIIGVSLHDTDPPAARDKPKFSYHDDAEKFMAARPDLVLIRPMIARAYGPFVEKLKRAGITVVSLQPVGVEEMFDYWRDLGTLTGRTEAAETMVRNFRAGVTVIREKVAVLPEAARKRVYFEAIHARMKSFAPDSTAIFALETAGGVNVAADADQVRKTNIAEYGRERILAKADEIDVYLAQSGAMNAVTVEAIRNSPGFSAIKAVRQGDIYLIDEKIVARPTPRLLSGIRAIAEILYPERMAAD